MGYQNKKQNSPHCTLCRTGEYVADLRLPYACKLLFQVLPGP